MWLGWGFWLLMIGLGEWSGYLAQVVPFIIWIGVVAYVAKMADSGILL